MMNTETSKAYTLIKFPVYVGGYCIGTKADNCYYIINFTHKPLWLHRKMMRIFFGFEWIDF